MPDHALILSKHADRYHALLCAQHLPGLVLHASTSLRELPPDAKDCSILFADPDLAQELLPSLPNLRWIQSTWAGVTPLIQRPERHYRLTNVKGVFGPLMSEYVFAHLLSHERRLATQQEVQEQHRWEPILPGSLQGKAIGLLGLGSIGLHLAGTAKHFGLRTLGCSRSPTPHPLLDALYRTDQLHELISSVDYLVAALPSTPETRNLLDAGALSHFRPGAVLINVGRGDLIDDDALVAALETSRLGAAVLDVFRQEPLPRDHSFWATDKLTLTAHTAAPSFPEEIAPIFIDNYQRYRAGESLKFQVDFERGY